MRSVATLVVGLSLAAPLAAAGADPPGKSEYERYCGVCHGADGRGEAGPPLVPLNKELAEVLAIVREGIGEMPPVGPSTLSDEGVERVVRFLNSLGAAPAPRSSARIVPRMTGGRRPTCLHGPVNQEVARSRRAEVTTLAKAGIKTTTGDPANPVDGVLYLNTEDRKLSVSADGDWRTLQSTTDTSW